MSFLTQLLILALIPIFIIVREINSFEFPFKFKWGKNQSVTNQEEGKISTIFPLLKGKERKELWFDGVFAVH